VLAALDRQRNADGVIPLTFEIVYGHAWKLAPRGKQATDDQGRAVVPVDSIGRARPRPKAVSRMVARQCARADCVDYRGRCGHAQKLDERKHFGQILPCSGMRSAI
jgi:hypothetical protein